MALCARSDYASCFREELRYLAHGWVVLSKPSGYAVPAIADIPHVSMRKGAIAHGIAVSLLSGVAYGKQGRWNEFIHIFCAHCTSGIMKGE